MSLPEQKQLDAVIGKLSRLQDTMDEVHREADRAGVARLAPVQPEVLEGVEVQWPIKLDGLILELDRASKWAREEWASATDEKWTR